MLLLWLYNTSCSLAQPQSTYYLAWINSSESSPLRFATDRGISQHHENTGLPHPPWVHTPNIGIHYIQQWCVCVLLSELIKLKLMSIRPVYGVEMECKASKPPKPADCNASWLLASPHPSNNPHVRDTQPVVVERPLLAAFRRPFYPLLKTRCWNKRPFSSPYWQIPSHPTPLPLATSSSR